MLSIVKYLTKINFTDKNDTSRIKYIVVHYYGSLGTAKGVANYFANAYRGASAHYAVDDDPIVYQMVEDEDIAWHCGTSGKYYHPDCRNSNSLGIEVKPYKLSTATMNASDRDWYFSDKTLANLVELVSMKMKQYNVPIDRVIRHYDVTHKLCPRPQQGSDINTYYNKTGDAMWDAFKAALIEYTTPTTVIPSSTSTIVRITTGALNIRKGPGTGYAVAGCIRDKGVYTIVETSGNWGKLKSGAGWICLDYAKVIGGSVAATPPPKEATPVDTSFKVQVNASALNIRKGPGTGYAKNGMITDKGVYTIVDTSGTWGKLKSGAGWISLNYTKRI